MFWAINFDVDEETELIEKSETEASKEKEKNRPMSEKSRPDNGKGLKESSGSGNSSWLDSVKSTVKSAVDCCKEI